MRICGAITCLSGAISGNYGAISGSSKSIGWREYLNSLISMLQEYKSAMTASTLSLAVFSYFFLRVMILLNSGNSCV